MSGIKVGVASVGFLATFLLGGVDKLLQVFFLFLILDYVTGMAEAYVTGKWNSNVGAKGIVKKVGFVVLVIVAQQADQLIEAQFGIVFRSLVLWMLVSNEGLSILENLGGMGLPIPSFLKDAISSLNKVTQSAKFTPPAATTQATPITNPSATTTTTETPAKSTNGGVGI